MKPQDWEIATEFIPTHHQLQIFHAVTGANQLRCPFLHRRHGKECVTYRNLGDPCDIGNDDTVALMPLVGDLIADGVTDDRRATRLEGGHH